jgi:hypothetical protein
MSKRKQLIGSILLGIVLIVAGGLLSTYTSVLLVIGVVWIYVAPAFFASRYGKDLGMPGGSIVIPSLFLPVIIPAVVAAWSKPTLPQLSQETQILGKTIREWGLGEAIQAFRTNMFLGRGGKTLILAKEGIIGDDRRISGAVSWNQVKEVFQTLQDRYLNGSHTASIRIYQMSLADGRKVVVDGRYGNIEILGQKIQAAVTQSLYQPVSQALGRGEPLVFGQVGISASGISVKGNQLPWAEANDVTIKSGFLVVSRNAKSRSEYAVKRSSEAIIGGLTRVAGRASPVLERGHGVQWMKLAASSVPNIYLVVLLAKELIGHSVKSRPEGK